jgi:putative redox protein
MTDNARWVTARIGKSGFHTNVNAGPSHMIADEPASVGGTDRGPTPYEFLLAGLGSCTAMTLRVYADRKKWPLEGAIVEMRSGRSHEEDCVKCETERVGIGTIERRITLEGPLTDEQRSRILEIAERCPVKQTLERGIRVVTVD